MKHHNHWSTSRGPNFCRGCEKLIRHGERFWMAEVGEAHTRGRWCEDCARKREDQK